MRLKLEVLELLKLLKQKSKFYTAMDCVLLPLSSQWDETNLRKDVTSGQARFPNTRAHDHDYVKADKLTTHSTASCSFIGMNMLNNTGP